MSFRYAAGINKPGFNALAPSTYLYNLFSWGTNGQGQLGLGNRTYYSSPKQVGSLTTWYVLSGNYQSYGIKTDGTLWAWGSNFSGALGLGNSTNYSSPKQVGALTNWSKISAGAYYALAVKTDGTLWTWGYNAFGQLGTGNLTNYSSPKQIGSLTNWSSVFGTSNYNSFAIKTDGTLWAWGNNASGDLGLGNRTDYSSPKQVGALTNWLKVNRSSAIKTDGSLWIWGANGSGQLGLNNRTYYSSPKQVGSLTTWLNVAMTSFTLATKTDGTLWTWGSNDTGQLGLNNITNYSSPKQVGSNTNWSTVSCSDQGFSISVKTDGTLWSWGKNDNGMLGLNNRINYSSPKQVGSSVSWFSATCGSNHVLSLG